MWSNWTTARVRTGDAGQSGFSDRDPYPDPDPPASVTRTGCSDPGYSLLTWPQVPAAKWTWQFSARGIRAEHGNGKGFREGPEGTIDWRNEHTVRRRIAGTQSDPNPCLKHGMPNPTHAHAWILHTGGAGVPECVMEGGLVVRGLTAANNEVEHPRLAAVGSRGYDSGDPESRRVRK
ncbi:hypothetical protein BDZ89DRAFT_1070382 [Hymenopellis radicata]|nr:hypothetical protein BDZ89DRAFT_1070382 [Hymenopellis radicata]